MTKPTDHIGPTTAHLECRVAGCGAAFDVPIVYRLEYETTLPGLADLEGVELGRPVSSLMNVSVVLDVDATLAGEYPLRAHLDGHATNGAPPVVEPPTWPDVEWCDGGGSCEHDACLDELEPEPSRCDCGHLGVDHHERDGCGACALTFYTHCRRWDERWRA